MELLCKTGGTQLVCTVAQRSKVIGYVVIDSIVIGHPYGDHYILPHIDEYEMQYLHARLHTSMAF